MVQYKTPEEIELIRESCQLAAEILHKALDMVKPGVTTEEINKFVHDYTVEKGAIPAPLNYNNFPKSVCTSVNDCVCHGIPGDYALEEGDIINIDVTCILNGYHGDTSKTVGVGEVSSEAKKLMEITSRCLDEGISAALPGNRFGDIGTAIQNLADEYGYGIVKEFCGHGIGRSFHEDPMVIHYHSRNRGAKIKEGMVFTIEPMINEGEPDIKVLDDKWTVLTLDGSLSAQFEHTIGITRNGPEILTLWE